MVDALFPAPLKIEETLCHRKEKVALHEKKRQIHYLHVRLPHLDMYSLTFRHEYVKWLDPLLNRRQSILEESRLFTRLNDYHILKAGCCGAWSLLPLLRHAFTMATSSQYAKNVWDNLNVCCCGKLVLHFPGVETFFQCMFCALSC